MSTLVFSLILAVVVTGFLFSGLMIMGSVLRHAIRLFRMFKAVPLRMPCPMTTQTTNVRVDGGSDGLEPRVVYCERFGAGELRCRAQCVPRWDELTPRKMAA
jgi:hypothetical protein